MKPAVRALFNPIQYWRAWRYSTAQKKYDRSEFDLELWLYSKILKNDLLHYGYFENPHIQPSSISIELLESAQERYADRIIEQLMDKSAPVLDVGCGMGGLIAKLLNLGYTPHALTPNDHQFDYIAKKYPKVVRYHCPFQEMQTKEDFGAIVHSESLQYIPLEAALAKVDQYLKKNGRWIVTDYFRIADDGHPSGHLLEDFYTKTKAAGFEIIKEEDMTDHVLPTLKLVHLYVERFLMPLKHFGKEKLRFKKPFLYYMTKGFHSEIEAKIHRELSSVDPVKFKREKRYMQFVLKKSTTELNHEITKQ